MLDLTILIKESESSRDQYSIISSSRCFRIKGSYEYFFVFTLHGWHKACSKFIEEESITPHSERTEYSNCKRIRNANLRKYRSAANILCSYTNKELCWERPELIIPSFHWSFVLYVIHIWLYTYIFIFTNFISSSLISISLEICWGCFKTLWWICVITDGLGSVRVR
jgi:hypothetical protein